MSKFNLQVFVPEADNAGKLAPAHVLEHVLGVLCELGGGATVYRVEGVWAEPRSGRVYLDRVAIAETDAEAPEAELWTELEALAAYVKAALGQEAVYVRLRAAGRAGAL